MQKGVTMSEEQKTTMEVLLNMISDKETINPYNSDPEIVWKLGIYYYFVLNI